MKAFIINLDSAKDRWAFIEDTFACTRFPVVRIPAVDGNAIELPHADFDERRFQLFHGRTTNVREIGCYLSHIKAMRAFLETGDERGLICEDDIAPAVELEQVVERALLFSKRWNILRLSGLGEGTPLKLAVLNGGHRLCVSLGRLKGTGIYVIDRKAAQILARRLLPMWLPFDHALDREWHFGLRAAYVLPFPCSQTGGRFRSSIQTGHAAKQSASSRWRTTYPYQICNEFTRWFFRGWNFVFAKVAIAMARDPHC